jgi:hypothetical protein
VRVFNFRLTVLFLGIVPWSFLLANVGETETQIDARYGKTFGDVPTKAFGVMKGFVFGGYVVGVKVVDGISEMEMFSKSDQSDFPASELDKLIKGTDGSVWKAEQTGKSNWRRWRREDGNAVALYDASRHFLYISSGVFYETKGRQIEQQEWNSREQFEEKPSPLPARTTTPEASPSP